MSTVTASWTTTDQNFQAGTVIAGYTATLTGGSVTTPVVQAIPTGTTATFTIDGMTDDPANPLTVTVQLVDGGGAPLGASASGHTQQPVVGQVPAAVSVTFAA